jgi:hypothetical protein
MTPYSYRWRTARAHVIIPVGEVRPEQFADG